MIRATIIALTLQYAAQYGVQPEFALAVAHVESRTKHQEFRVGKVSKFWMPYAIHQDYKKLRGWPVDTLEGNIEAGVRALRGSCKRSILQNYNRKFTEAYYQEVLRAEARYALELYGLAAVQPRAGDHGKPPGPAGNQDRPAGCGEHHKPLCLH